MEKESKEKHYQVTLTETQLRALSEASEAISRLAMGQFDVALQFCAQKGQIIPIESIKKIEAIIKPHMGLASNASLGVGKSLIGDRYWDLYQVFRHQLSWDHAIENNLTLENGGRNFNTMMGVHYDHPMRYSDQPLPTITSAEPSIPTA